jgi:WD40 repeat protein
MGCTSETHCLDVYGTGSEFVSGHKSGDVRLWSLTQQKVMKVLSNIHSDKIECIKYIERNNQIVTLGRDHLI